MKKTLVFIVQQLSQPRCIKRIATIQAAGIPVKVYGFNNGLYTENLVDLPYTIETIFNHNKTVSRQKKVLSFRRAIKHVLDENKVDSMFYFFGFEIASIAYLLGCRNYIYEEADVSAARIGSSLARKALLYLDRQVAYKSALTVYTSAGFVDYIFGNSKRPTNYILLPNKLNSYFDTEKKSKVERFDMNAQHIRFGFVGAIRYPNTIIRFAKVVGKEFPQHQFHFFGDAEKKEYIDDELRSYSNIFLHGAFKNPIDLPAIYQSIDISVACYDTQSENVRIAEPNKLYESIFFETPIVVSSNTYLAKRIAEYSAGDAIDASRDETIIKYINSINTSRMKKMVDNMHKVNYTELIDSADVLIDAVRKIVK